MVSYSNENDLLKSNDCKILSYCETQIGVEYILYSDGKFKKCIYNNMKLTFEEVISFKEFFSYMAKGIRLMIFISYSFMFEILIGLIVLILFKMNFSIVSFTDKVLYNWLWVVCSTLFICRKSNFLLDLSKIVLNSLLMIHVGLIAIEVCNYAFFIKILCVISCGVFIFFNALLLNLKAEKISLYNSLKEEYLC